jgi:hypothetical protein
MKAMLGEEESIPACSATEINRLHGSLITQDHTRKLTIPTIKVKPLKRMNHKGALSLMVEKVTSDASADYPWRR